MFHARRTELESVRLKPETIESIIKNEFADRAEGELDRVKKLGGDILILDDGSYPSLLREIADPPITLYVRGDWQACLEQPCVGVIGSRQCSTYGENASEMLSRDLASRGITVVSGLARGIDSAAHQGACREKVELLPLWEPGSMVSIRKRTSALSEKFWMPAAVSSRNFPLGTPPLKDNFPYRNRIISGLSLRRFDRRGVRA